MVAAIVPFSSIPFLDRPKRLNSLFFQNQLFILVNGSLSLKHQELNQDHFQPCRFIKQCDLDSEDIFKFLTEAPLFLALSFDNLALKLGLLVKTGYEYRTKELAAAMGAATRTSCENMQKVMGLFISYGLSLANIFTVSKKHPQILQYNHISLEEKMEYLIDDMGREVGELLAFPAFLGYKLDDRTKHRFEVNRKTIGEGMTINKLLNVSAERFSTKMKKNPV